MTTNDIDAIEARLEDENAKTHYGLELLGVYFDVDEARAICAEVRELRAALERARALAEQLKQMSTDPGPWAQRDAYEYAAEQLAAALAGADGAR